MNITPLEIRQKTFEKEFRGFDKDEVNAFLLSLAQEWEKLQDERRESKYKLESTEKEIVKLKEVENSLFRTLKTADETSSNIIEQANKSAELHVKEAQIKADGMVHDAKSKAKNIIEEAENKSRHILDSLEHEVKELEKSYRSLENHRDNLLADLRNLSNDTLDRVEKIVAARKKSSFDAQLTKAREIQVNALAELPDYSPPAAEQERSHTAYPQQETQENLTHHDDEDGHEASMPEQDGNRGKTGNFFDEIN